VLSCNLQTCARPTASTAQRKLAPAATLAHATLLLVCVGAPLRKHRALLAHLVAAWAALVQVSHATALKQLLEDCLSFFSDPHPTVLIGLSALSLNLAIFSQHTPRQLVRLCHHQKNVLSHDLQHFLRHQACCTQQTITICMFAVGAIAAIFLSRFHLYR
jgi:hypothetical protein